MNKHTNQMRKVNIIIISGSFKYREERCADDQRGVQLDERNQIANFDIEQSIATGPCWTECNAWGSEERC